MNKISLVKTFIIDIAWVFCIFLLLYFSYAVLHNTLEHNGQWNSTKTQLEKGVMGSWSFFQGTQPLRHNHLDLSAWFGYQEVISKKEYTPAEIKFRFLLKPDAYIYAIFGKSDSIFSAYRLSTNKIFSNSFVAGETSGRFRSTRDFNAEIKPDRWHYATIKFFPDKFSPNGKLVILYIDKKEVASFLSMDLTLGFIGFRGGAKTSLVDDIVVTDRTNSIVFRDSFSFGDWQVAVWFVFGSIIFFLILERIRRAFRKKARRKSILPLTFQISVLVFVLVLYVIISHIADGYPRTENFVLPFLGTKNKFSKENEIENINKTILSIAPKTGYRILFLGGSQTWGAGARKDNETIVADIERGLNQLRAYNASGTPFNVLGASNTPIQLANFETVNAGIFGTDSTDLLKLYKSGWKNVLNPDMVVLNMSYNEPDPGVFYSNLYRFFSLNKPNIKTIFVLEAASLEDPNREINLEINHNAMIRVSDKFHIPILNLDTYLQEKNSTGILWWDGMHLTTYGQMLAAEFISDNIIKLAD